MGFWASLFRRKIQQQNFIVKTPEHAIKDLQRDYYGKQLLKRNAQLETELIKKEAELKKFQIKKEVEKEEAELEKEIWAKRKHDKSLDRWNSIIFKLIGAKPPVLIMRNNKPYGKFVGISAKQQDDGTTLWYLIIKVGSKLRRINCPSGNPMEFFHSLINFPSQMRAGKLDVDVDIGKDGRPILVKERDIIEKLVETKYGKNLKVVHLDEVERRELEQEKLQLREQLKQVYSALRQAQEREVEYEYNQNEMELENTALSKDRDLHASRMVSMMDKQHAMAVETAKANTSIQDSILSQILTEKAFKSVLDAYDDKVSKLASRMSKEDLDIAKEEVKKTILEGVAIRRGAESATKMVMQPAPSEKDIEKAMEK